MGTTEYRYIVTFTQATYIIGGYIGTDTKSGYHLSKAQLDELLTSLHLTPDTLQAVFTSPIPEGEWKTFSDSSAGISFKYPAGWTLRSNGQSFPNGDLFTLQAIGETQRPQTELHDGVIFAVMKPEVLGGDLQAWLKQRYESSNESGRAPEYSRVTFGGVVYDKVYICGLGCFTYYHTVQNGKLYGFVVNATGPHEYSYMQTVDKIMSGVKY